MNFSKHFLRYSLACGIAGGLSFGFPSGFSSKDFEELNIIAGEWTGQRKGGVFGESWKKVHATELAGMSFKVVKGDSTPLETVKLYLQGSDIIYAPVAFGQNNDREVLFRLKTRKGNKFVFENPAHEFPTQIVYDFVSKDSLHAYIEGKIKSKNTRIDYHYGRKK